MWGGTLLANSEEQDQAVLLFFFGFTKPHRWDTCTRARYTRQCGRSAPPRSRTVYRYVLGERFVHTIDTVRG